jgi:hypothetical protein
MLSPAAQHMEPKDADAQHAQLLTHLDRPLAFDAG